MRSTDAVTPAPAYDEFGLFHENAEEFGIPFAAAPAVQRVSVPIDGAYELSALQFTLLTNLQAGLPLGRAIAAAADRSHETAADFETHIRHWFTTWSASGFFAETAAHHPDL